MRQCVCVCVRIGTCSDLIFPLEITGICSASLTARIQPQSASHLPVLFPPPCFLVRPCTVRQWQPALSIIVASLIVLSTTGKHLILTRHAAFGLPSKTPLATARTHSSRWSGLSITARTRTKLQLLVPVCSIHDRHDTSALWAHSQKEPYPPFLAHRCGHPTLSSTASQCGAASLAASARSSGLDPPNCTTIGRS